MELATIIFRSSMFIFLLPPIRQFRGRYFYFFLTLAVEDPLGSFLVHKAHFDWEIVHIVFSVLLLTAIIKPEKFLKKSLHFLPFFLFVILFYYIFKNYYKFVHGSLEFGIGLMHFIIFVALIKQSILLIRERMEINIFQILLILYETSIISKFITYSLLETKGLIFLFITLAFELILGLFFSIFRSDNPKLFIRLNYEMDKLPGNT